MGDVLPAEFGREFSSADMEVRRAVLRTLALARHLPGRDAKRDLAQWLDAANEEVARQWGLA